MGFIYVTLTNLFVLLYTEITRFFDAGGQAADDSDTASVSVAERAGIFRSGGSGDTSGSFNPT